MILDEIDELVDTLNKVYDNMEQIYALYIREFPEESRRIDELKEILRGNNLNTVGDHEYSAPRHSNTDETLPAHNKQLMVMKGFDAKESTRREEPHVETVYVEESRESPLKMTLRQLFRKINQLCHPDKCKRFSSMENKRLRQCFDEAQEAYKHQQYDTLELIYIRVIYLRDELYRLDDGIKASLEAQRNGLLLDLQEVSKHRVYLTLHYHMQRFIMEAKYQFSLFLEDEIQKLESEVGAS